MYCKSEVREISHPRQFNYLPNIRVQTVRNGSSANRVMSPISTEECEFNVVHGSSEKKTLWDERLFQHLALDNITIVLLSGQLSQTESFGLD